MKKLKGHCRPGVRQWAPGVGIVASAGLKVHYADRNAARHRSLSPLAQTLGYGGGQLSRLGRLVGNYQKRTCHGYLTPRDVVRQLIDANVMKPAPVAGANDG